MKNKKSIAETIIDRNITADEKYLFSRGECVTLDENDNLYNINPVKTFMFKDWSMLSFVFKNYSTQGNKHANVVIATFLNNVQFNVGINYEPIGK